MAFDPGDHGVEFAATTGRPVSSGAGHGGVRLAGYARDSVPEQPVMFLQEPLVFLPGGERNIVQPAGLYATTRSSSGMSQVSTPSSGAVNDVSCAAWQAGRRRDDAVNQTVAGNRLPARVRDRRAGRHRQRSLPVAAAHSGRLPGNGRPASGIRDDTDGDPVRGLARLAGVRDSGTGGFTGLPAGSGASPGRRLTMRTWRDYLPDYGWKESARWAPRWGGSPAGLLLCLSGGAACLIEHRFQDGRQARTAPRKRGALFLFPKRHGSNQAASATRAHSGVADHPLAPASSPETPSGDRADEDLLLGKTGRKGPRAHTAETAPYPHRRISAAGSATVRSLPQMT